MVVFAPNVIDIEGIITATLPSTYSDEGSKLSNAIVSRGVSTNVRGETNQQEEFILRRGSNHRSNMQSSNYSDPNIEDVLNS